MRKKHGGRKRRDLKAVNATDLIGELDIEIGAMENTLTSFTEIFNNALSTNREDEYPFDHIHASIAINDKYRKPRNGPMHPRNCCQINSYGFRIPIPTSCHIIAMMVDTTAPR